MTPAISNAVATVTAVDIFNDFALNETAENDGIWVDYKGGVEFLIARDNNRKYKKRVNYNYNKYQRLLESKTPEADKKSDELMIEVMAETILLGWRGPLSIKGVRLEYSRENAKTLLALPMFREWVMAQARDQEVYKAVQDDENEKN